MRIHIHTTWRTVHVRSARLGGPTVSSEKTWVVIILSESLNISLRDSVSRRWTRVAQVHWSAYERKRPTPACHTFHSADLCPTQTLASCVEGTTLPTNVMHCTCTIHERLTTALISRTLHSTRWARRQNDELSPQFVLFMRVVRAETQNRNQLWPDSFQLECGSCRTRNNEQLQTGEDDWNINCFKVRCTFFVSQNVSFERIWPYLKTDISWNVSNFQVYDTYM